MIKTRFLKLENKEFKPISNLELNDYYLYLLDKKDIDKNKYNFWNGEEVVSLDGQDLEKEAKYALECFDDWCLSPIELDVDTKENCIKILTYYFGIYVEVENE